MCFELCVYYRILYEGGIGMLTSVCNAFPGLLKTPKSPLVAKQEPYVFVKGLDVLMFYSGNRGQVEEKQ